MVYESIDHENDVTCQAMLVFCFWSFVKKNVIVKNKSIITHWVIMSPSLNKEYCIAWSALLSSSSSPSSLIAQ